jgi:L-seryl-tRNA(Ser) seleniumtransferase
VSRELLRSLPSVDSVLAALDSLTSEYPRALVTAEVRRAIAAMRQEILEGRDASRSAEARVRDAFRALETPSLSRVINATGVVLHTNLGRAPLGRFEPVAGYSNLEYDAALGKRGNRDVHAGALLERLLGRPAIAVNNNAAALFLALNELAAGFEAIVSRGELIEIGDGFRIPAIMDRSGALLREVGTTNRTTIADYREAITDRTRLLLRIHPSNFRIEGFTARASLAELAGLGRERGIPVYEDLGSGCFADLSAFGIREPLVSTSLEDGADLVSFSGDKLLGGPQAGVLAGNPELVARLRRNPLFRVLRLDKLVCQSLESTLRNVLFERWDRIPALGMIRRSAEEIRERAGRLAARIGGVVEPAESMIGGGSTPGQSVPTYVIAIAGGAAALDRRLRKANPPVIARVENDRLLIDLRTVFPEEEEELAAAFAPA